jgi:hypothetical protein
MEREGKVKSFKVVLLSILVITLFAAFLLVVTTSKPVKANPGTISSENFTPTDDSGFSLGYPTYINGLNYNMYNGYAPDTYGAERVYLKFDLSKIPRSATIISAVLSLNSKYGPSTGVAPYPPTSHLVDAHPVNDDSWLESTLCGDNAPTPDPTVLDTANFQADDYVGTFVWYNWNVKTYVVSQIAGGDGIISIDLQGQNEGGDASAGWFYSKENPTNPSGWPYSTNCWPCLSVVWETTITENITPKTQIGAPGSALTYTVTVGNYTGAAATFDLAVDSNWNTSLPSSVGPISNGGTQNVTLTVTCENGYGFQDTITVTATCQGSPEITTYQTCTASTAPIAITADAYVIEQDPDYNSGDDHSVYVGTLENGSSMDTWSPEDCRGYWKIDLSGLPSGAVIDNAYFTAYTAFGGENGGWVGSTWVGTAGYHTLTATIKGVSDDSWNESTITWNNAPSMGSSLDSVDVRARMIWYSWNVTSFVASQVAGGDRVISLGMVSENEGVNVVVPWTSKDDPTYGATDKAQLIVSYTSGTPPPTHGVNASISPSSKNGPPGSTLTYTVTVKNTGTASDTYSLTTADNAGWSRTISPASLPLAASASGTATLSVTVPENALEGTRDNIIVRATSTENTEVWAENSSIARAIAVTVRGVEVSISPDSQDNENGGTLMYTVTVTNTGTVTEDYDLAVDDDAGWTLTLPSSVTDVVPDEGRQVMLTVRIPATAANGASTTITVTATSSENTEVENSDTCVANCVITPTGQGVQVTISGESSKSGKPGDELSFTVVVTNTGTGTDTFSVTAEDTENWAPTVSPGLFSIGAGASRSATLRIIIPSTAADGASATITVTAAGTGYENSAICTATAQAGGGISPFVYVGVVVVIVAILGAVLIFIKPF